MAKQRKGHTRRQFLWGATVATGGLVFRDLIPSAWAQAPKLGAQLIGKLEGPELILEQAKWPKKFS